MLMHGEVQEMLSKYAPQTDTTVIETMRYALLNICHQPGAPLHLKQILQNKGLTEFETIQLLNYPPKKLIDIYVVVQDLDDRLSETEIDELLALLQPYSVSQP